MASIKSDLLELKNGPTNQNENYSINIDHVKNKMGRGRGRPPKNSYSSSGSTCSENSKDVIFNQFFLFKSFDVSSLK